jgi:diguanylate cyclase (GGDEF)-like protein/PAS domain S-box-containing protein
MESGNKFDAPKLFMLSVTALGAAALAWTVYRSNLVELGVSYLIFSLVTLLFASRIQVQIPLVKSHISVSDTFVFLAILLYGGEAGIMLAAADAFFASRKVAKNPITLSYNVAVFTLSTFVTVYSLRFFFGPLRNVGGSQFTTEFIGVICMMGLIQYVMNSGLVAIAVALRAKRPIWEMWKENFLWTSITYFAGASAAGIIDKLINHFGIFAFLAVTPIVAIVYFTYTTYLKNVESASAQAAQAEKHVQQLSHHIAEQERISRALRESEEYFRNAFDNAAGMAVINPDGKWMQVNESLCSMLGYSEQELLTQGFQAITHPDDLGNDLSNLYQLLAKKIPGYQLEKRYSHKSGTTVWVLQSASLIHDADGQPRHVIFQIQDISDRKKAEESIQHAAFHDALTGLPNRTLFSDRLKMAVERAKRDERYEFAVIFIDLDRFKIVNDSLGHGIGDQLLIDLSRRLENGTRAVDTVARLGGDEFAILQEDIASRDDTTDLTERLQSSLKEPFILDGHPFSTTASMGIAYSGSGYDRPEDILRDADTAMYRAKANGKARHEVFDRSMHARAVSVLTVEAELRNALEKHEIVPYFQPIVSLHSGTIAGFEALARWNHPSRGLVSPADFIPLAEETDLIVPIGYSILEQACERTVEWQEEYDLPNLSVSVNLSGKQCRKATMVETIQEILYSTGLAARSLKIEITETVVMEDMLATTEILDRLKAIGVNISIDDFGTGYSSLSYLHRFPFDFLKVDRSFVAAMTTEKESRAIVNTIIALAAGLGRSVIAEGVETAEQQRVLSELGCQFGQGFLFSKPIDSNSAAELLEIGSSWELNPPQMFELGPIIARQSEIGIRNRI